MMRNTPGHGRRALLLSAVVLAAAVGPQIANAATIAWERSGIFERCLDTRMEAWIKAKVELVINEDPAAGDLDDIDVALWAAQALESCEAQAGHGNQTSEGRFARHMAHWREHIYGLAQTIRQRVRAD